MNMDFASHAPHIASNIAPNTIFACVGIACTATFSSLIALPAWAQQDTLDALAKQDAKPATTAVITTKPQRKQTPVKQTPVKQTPAILTATIERSPQDGVVKSLTVTGPSKIGIRKILDVQEAEEGNTRWSNGVLGRDGDIDGNPTVPYYTVVMETDPFSDEQFAHLVVKVGDTLCAPYSYGGAGGGINTTFELRNVDKSLAEALCGSELPAAPKKSLTVTFEAREIGYSPVRPGGAIYFAGSAGSAGSAEPPSSVTPVTPVTPVPDVATGWPFNITMRVAITLTNVGKTPLSLAWGTVGASNQLARDTQLFFTATREGATKGSQGSPGRRALAPKRLLPDGYIRSSTQLLPQSCLHRSEYADQWFKISEPGKYRVGASYKVFIKNPDAGAFPSQWTVVYHSEFLVLIGK